MEKKIKSVKLIDNYLVKRSSGKWTYQFCDYPTFSEDTILDNPNKFEIEYEPERKKIILEIESDFNNFDIHWLETALKGYCHSAKFVFTELPEVFAREDMEGLARWVEGKDDKDKDRFKNIVDNFMRDKISERKSNGR